MGSACSLIELAIVNINLPSNSASKVDATIVYSPANIYKYVHCEPFEREQRKCVVTYA